MTPLILTVLSPGNFITIAHQAAGLIAALDEDTVEMVEDAITQMGSDFFAYATAFGLGRIPELLIDDPKLAVLGQVIFGGPGVGLTMAYDDLILSFSFGGGGIVLEELSISCDG